MSVGSEPFFGLSLFYVEVRGFHLTSKLRGRTCSTKMLNLVFSPVLPSCRVACSTSFSSSLTAYSKVVRVSSTSSTMRILFPIRLAISSELRSSHWVRVTFVPGASSGPSVPNFSYNDRPMAWMGMFAEPGCFRNDLVVYVSRASKP